MVLRSSRRNDGGYSLVELLVVMAILGVVGAIVTSAIIQSSKATRRAQERITALADLQKGLDRVGRELRAADPLILDSSGDYDSSIGAEVLRGGVRYRFSYYLVTTADGDELRQDIATLDSSGAVVSTDTGLFIANIANDVLSPSVPLFTYRNSSGETIACTDLDLSLAADQATCRDRHLTAAQVELAIGKTLPEQDPLLLETVINIRNTRFG